MHSELDPPDLSGRTALITGTTRGIGKALALALADCGAAIVSTGKTTETDDTDLPGSVEATARAVRDRGSEALAVELDVRDAEACRRVVDAAVDRFGAVDILVNNAGAIQLDRVADLPTDRFDLLHEVNVRGAYACTRAALPGMRDRGFGHVLNMAPPISVDSAPDKAPYALSKLGMTFLAKSIAAEHEGEGIAVNALWPVTAIETRATRYFGLGTEADWRTPAVVCDAALTVLDREPPVCTGRALYDETVLEAVGVTDFSPYAVQPGTEPEPLSARLFDPDFSRADHAGDAFPT